MIDRIMEFCDTIFMVLRKKTSKVTPVHVYHHSVVPLICWVTFKHNGMIPFIRLCLLANCGLHAAQYGYLTAIALWPDLRSQLWLKRLVYRLEIWHFAIIGVFYTVVLFMQSGYPVLWLAVMAIQLPVFALLYAISKHSEKIIVQ